MLSGLDPLANAVVTPGATVIRPWLYSNDGRLITVIAMLIAGGSALAIARGGRIGVAGLLSTLMIVPFFLVAVSSYGGEGILRSALFSSPWVAVLVAWGIYLLPRGARLLAGSVVALGLIGLVTIGIMANASFNVIPPAEVTASEYFYAHAPPGSILVQIGGDFPSEVGIRYADMADPATEGSPTLFDYGWADSPRFGARSIEDLIVSIDELSLTPFVVFSTSDERLVDDEHLARPGAVTALEHAVATSSVFRLWYANKDTRICRARRLTDAPSHQGSSDPVSTRPSVSVVVSAYTEARWAALSEAADAALAQSPDELLVVIDHNDRLLERARRQFPTAVVYPKYGPPWLVRRPQHRDRGLDRRDRRVP